MAEYAIMDDHGILFSGNEEEVKSIFYGDGILDRKIFGDLTLIQIVNRREKTMGYALTILEITLDDSKTYLKKLEKNGPQKVLNTVTSDIKDLEDAIAKIKG